MIADSDEKLRRDAVVLRAMAGEMGNYLDSTALFWTLGPTMPQLTIGGYLMREYRLLELRRFLPADVDKMVETAVIQFNAAIAERIVKFEKKAGKEVEARLRQWEATQRDYQQRKVALNYKTAVEARLMLHALLDRLALAPYQFPKRYEEKVRMLDNTLADLWRRGDFIFPAPWTAAYPREQFWWLYGEPQEAPART